MPSAPPESPAPAAPADQAPPADQAAPADGGLVLVVDFGSQFTQLIARRLREAGCPAEIVPCTAPPGAVESRRPSALVLSGGPDSAAEGGGGPPARPEWLALGVPVLGVCYGQQAMARALGGRVLPPAAAASEESAAAAAARAPGAAEREFGRAEVEVLRASPLLDGVWRPGERRAVWMSHADRVAEPPPGFVALARSASGAGVAAMADERRRLYGLQFHPEVAHTPDGARLLANFALRVAGVAPSWSMESFRARAVAALRDQVKERRVLLALSGGVDSAVAAALLHEAVGDRLDCVLVDNGLLRAGEADEVEALFRGRFQIPLTVARAEARFLSALAGVSDPEEKRRRIGREFVRVFEEQAERLAALRGGRIDLLAQGTLYPDVIESISPRGGPSRVIKSHHNVGGLPERMKMQVVEPLRELFKDEVRALGAALGIPRAFLSRHPFPGPGLAVRIPGPVDASRLALLRPADAIFVSMLREAGLYDSVWQAFAVLLPVRSVGVMGDARTWEEAVALRAVSSVDGMTAEASDLPLDFLRACATRIVNEVPGINRVLYDATSKPPGTIEWE